jgi:hypothetical protein
MHWSTDPSSSSHGSILSLQVSFAGVHKTLSLMQIDQDSTLMLIRSRIRLFTLMRIQIRLPKMMRIHKDPDPQLCMYVDPFSKYKLF